MGMRMRGNRHAFVAAAHYHFAMVGIALFPLWSTTTMISSSSSTTSSSTTSSFAEIFAEAVVDVLPHR